MGPQIDDEHAKLERLRAEVQKGMDDLEQGRFIEIASDSDLDALFDEVKRRVAAKRSGQG